MRERLRRFLFTENDIRQWRASDNAIERLHGEIVKLAFEVSTAAACVFPAIVVLAALHPDITLTYRLVEGSVVYFFTAGTAFVVHWLRCWFAD